jgi:hydroxymethylglutaryl-CoA lyase
VTGSRVTVVEVGPRDGLQNEPVTLSTDVKVRFIEMLADAGLPVVEATSFVHPAAVPQLADADQVLPRIRRRPGVRYPVLVPNMRGLERAVAAGADAVAVFTAASEAFASANINMTIAQSLEAFAPVLASARERGMWTRGYVSTAFGCPYQGAVSPAAVVEVAVALAGLGCDQISVGDTIGVAQPGDVERVVALLLERLPPERLALHLHDTRGRAIDNAEAGLRLGVTTFDSSAAGLGGCPFAPGAPGNLATETLVAWLHSRSIETGVDEAVLADAAAYIRGQLTRRPAPR